LSEIKTSHYKIPNRLTLKSIRNSIFVKVEKTISNLTFFFKPKFNLDGLSKNILIVECKVLLFVLLAIKFNNKFYTKSLVANANSFIYYENKLLLFQFELILLKVFSAYYPKNYFN
jgi:hypothetical protein